jgi:TolB-like protein/Flp pilus assembly protein TadD
MSETSDQAVFLSYAREDAVAARRIAEALRSSGIEVWFDENELRGGDEWDRKIRRQIDACALFVPIVSQRTQARAKGYFRLEWNLAVDQMRMMAAGVPFVAPIVIDETREAGAVVPPEFLRVQWTRLPGALPTPQFVEQVKSLLHSPLQPVLAGSRTGTPGVGPGSSRSRFPMWAGGAAAVVVMAVVGFFALRQRARDVAVPKPTVADTKPAAAPTTDKSIAVLPFVNLGADKGDDYLGDGMTEELLNALTKMPGLRVPGRSSSFAFKGQTGDDIFRRVGEKLRVLTVLEGSVRRAGDKLRITAQLINVADGYHLWSHEYSGDMNDLLAVQSDVARQVAQALKVKLGVEEAGRLERKTTANPEAYRLYLRGRFHLARAAPAEVVLAERFFGEAVALDPNFALAYCGWADALGWQGGVVMPAEEAWQKEKERAQKALALDASLPEAVFSLGMAQANAFEWKEGIANLRRALELNPNHALAHDQYAWVCSMFGRADEALRHSRRAIELDPLSTQNSIGLSYYFQFARRYDEALAQARRTQELDPRNAMVHSAIGWALLGAGKPEAAVVEFRAAQALDDDPDFASNMGLALAVAGDRAGAERVLRDLTELAKRRYVSPGALLTVYLGLGDKEKALDLLEECVTKKEPAGWGLKVWLSYDSVRNEPRFQALVKKAGLDYSW